MKTQETIGANFKRAKILVIEDNEDHWILIENAMYHCLSEVTTVWAKTPDQAMDFLNDWSIQEWEMPKLILLDLYMPAREHGWFLLKQIKAMPAPCSQIPIVVLSASDHPADIADAYQRGGSSYMVKPTTIAEWLAYFQELRNYWWETVTLPPMRFSV
ncbi:response regulator [Spirosoma endophyticum]|uniref:CheY chemotaxis protein or a CheY-like REC (Receiver) domain n=1 Tax=Spirosoma endophyticum TaxID=662367 RepID=A0A1I1YQD4_9BACT|nr:response regulator [Spirosoma endophyticum]SFE21228.1 CheY chemotaxis protein or a CheY-like REC (receiver) domain [Spirosoma endophyticum]